MAIAQPTSANTQNSPDHSALHRVIAADPAAAVQAVAVDGSNNTFIGDGGSTNYAKFTSAGRLSFGGTGGVSLPYGSFSDSTTQGIANVNNAYPITFNTDEAKSQVTHDTGSNPSRVQIDVAGTYLITFSAIGKSTVANKTLDIWLAVDGSPVARSNTISRFVGSGNERIITVTYIYTFTAGQYFELMWNSNDTGTTLIATGTQSNPTRPACPSIILTVNMISKD
jgi:hypothetical protein